MTAPLTAARAPETIELPPPRPRVEVETMAGTWFKTSEAPNWIRALEVEAVGDDLYVTVFGEQPPSPPDWGRIRARSVYAGAIGSGDARAGAFVALFELGDMSVELQANLNLGLLVVATFVRFRKPGSLADRFTREFFYRPEESV